MILAPPFPPEAFAAPVVGLVRDLAGPGPPESKPEQSADTPACRKLVFLRGLSHRVLLGRRPRRGFVPDNFGAYPTVGINL